MEILCDNKLDCLPSTVPKYAVVLTMSLNKRIVPRAYVMQVLLSKGLMKKKSLLKMLVRTESEFLNRCIQCHVEEASELLKLYHSKLNLARLLPNESMLENHMHQENRKSPEVSVARRSNIFVLLLMKLVEVALFQMKSNLR
ncbi:uncharacterized protein LOC129313119 [Prosopis cineraria]|uniref:uncharacterized protein LOC129313119 n=1 Tax=Prosopis cineraria TaxID=364024 RepID=UPI00240FB5F0|nr:uncharacterized protein LOC129313119 [Prosopis cineraria]